MAIFLVLLGLVTALFSFLILPALVPPAPPGLNFQTLFLPWVRPLGALLAFLFVFSGLMIVLRQWIDRITFRRQTGIESIRLLHWRDFERLLGETYRRQGYSVTLLGGARADGGVDLELRKDGQRLLVQAKQWRTTTVGVPKVRELWGAVADFGADGAIFVTSGRYTSDAQRWVHNKNLTLVDGPQLARMIKVIQQSEALPAPVAAAPTPVQEHACPRCGHPMVLRAAKRGAHAGAQFWGCSDYPRCHHTEPA